MECVQHCLSLPDLLRRVKEFYKLPHDHVDTQDGEEFVIIYLYYEGYNQIEADTK
jgi:hypothetical protein